MALRLFASEGKQRDVFLSLIFKKSHNDVTDV